MRNQLWIIILLMVWIGQWAFGVSEIGPQPKVSKRAVWYSAENLAELVEYQARRQMLGSCGRSYAYRRRQRRGQPAYRCVRGPKVEDVREAQSNDEGQTAQSKEKWKDMEETVFEAQRWGLSCELSRELPERLQQFCQRYTECFKTQTRNMGAYAYPYLSGLLRLEAPRNYTNIGRATGVAGENIQHFMSNSPWLGWMILRQVQEEIKATPGLRRGGMLLLDESAEEAAGDKKAGAGRQYNGRLGKVDMSRVGVFLAYANLTDVKRPVWTWVDGELYLQEHWLSPEMAEERQRVGIPPERTFQTKIELGYQMIQRVKARGLPFEAVACDDLYGRSPWLRDRLDEEELIYMADVPCSTQVYLEKPVLGVPKPVPGRRGPKPTRIRVLNDSKPFKVHQVARRADTIWKRVRVRPIERGELNDPFAARRVWTLREGKEPVEEWLVIRHEAKKRYNYALSNASAHASLQHLAWLKCQRYFVERANQDAKSEAGWDELQAQKYRGWKHHLALVILTTWFVAQIKWEWGHKHVRDPALTQHFAVDVLPALSMANIRVLLRAAMPLPQPTPEQAVALVIEKLVNRTRSRSSRLKRQRATYNAHAPP